MSVDLSLSSSGALATINKQEQGLSKAKSQQVLADTAVSQDATATKTNATRSFETVQQAAKAKELGDDKTKGLSNGNEPAEPVDREQLEVMAQQLQEFVSSLNRGLEFSVDEDSGRNVIKVIDKNDGKLVRQYPSEEVLELVANLSDAAGNLINSKV